MSKFNRPAVRPAATSPVVTASTPTARTHEGGPGFARDAKSELFLLAVTNMVAEKTFYESADARDARFEALVGQVAVADPAWMLGFVGWLRKAANMRSASIVAAAEAVRARLATPVEEGPVTNRQIIGAALLRPDEPGELLAYWMCRYGARIPKPVKRGIADAAVRLYNQRSLLKYDTDGKGIRFGRVLDLVHPVAQSPEQAALFAHMHERMRGRPWSVDPDALPVVAFNATLRELAAEDPAGLLDADKLRAAGMTWEDALSLAGNRVDKARLWEALIPSMGYMALLRNLRNFDQAGVSDATAQQVAVRLADPAEVAKSRQLPMRFLSAYRAAPSLRWSYPLEQALGHALANIPTLEGRTLILVDTSTSMNGTFSKDGTLLRWDAAVIFGVALAQRCAEAEVVSFSSTARYWGDPHGALTKVFPMQQGESLLRSVERWKSGGWFLGGGTATAAALRKHFAGQRRVVVLTDEQQGVDTVEVSKSVPSQVPMYTWNLAGYERGHAPSGGQFRHTFGGLTDQAFRMIPLLERGVSGSWPWESMD
ncbi:TROVE domain-containing protein [Micromonospora craterilacus]|uniref:TROVE domain-containing protein n=1 Tax=Micromonospora craterilacus TaxID=1655439 RepID=A0A2W2EHX2_9ACTN|nr:TROVE domain-containing protein [Micromonospora craterilacus]PZG16499.1 TROVE domain-containing protein [Micromonospora craterilacus]